MTARQTPLYAVHCALGARMTKFGGWNMPEHYGSIWGEYAAVRTKAGLFDTSHMRAFLVHGRDAQAFLQFLTPKNIGIRPGRVQYAVLTNRSGGAVDDCTIYCIDCEQYMVVVNAGNIDKDLAWMNLHAAGFSVVIAERTRYAGMLALQGPAAERILAKCIREADELRAMGKYAFRFMTSGGYTVIVSRTGYTGEDGFEILCEPALLQFFWEMILEAGRGNGIVPAGLGARDLLRLEAWMPLYGHELDETHGPLAAGLRSTINLEKSSFFIGRGAIEPEWYFGGHETLIGLNTKERDAIIRAGADIMGPDGTLIGHTTSGAPYPNGTSLGMGFIRRSPILRAGADVRVNIRNKWRTAQIIERTFKGTPKEAS